MRRTCRALGGLTLGAALLAAPAGAGQIELISRANPMLDQIDGIVDAAISADGRYVAFSSYDANLVPGQEDTNVNADVFLFDRVSRTTVLVSHTPGSATTAGNYYSWSPSISADGAWIAFASQAFNLAAGQTDGALDQDIFLYETATGNITVVSHTAGAAAITANLASALPRISADGRRVVYNSKATDLVAGQTDANGLGSDVFLYDRVDGTTTLVSRSAGSAATTGNERADTPWISAGGGVVVFSSFARDLIPGQVNLPSSGPNLFAYDVAAGTLALVTHAMGSPQTPSDQGAGYAAEDVDLSADGRYIAFTSNSSNLAPVSASASTFPDVYVHDRATGQTTLASHAHALPTVRDGGTSPSLSADGRWLSFRSTGQRLVEGQVDTPGTLDVFLRDRQAGATTLVSHAFGSPRTSGIVGPSWSSSTGRNRVSGDGRFVLYSSSARDLVAPSLGSGAGSSIFLYDRLSGTTVLASHATESRTLPANDSSGAVGLSADGGQVIFWSLATNLAGGEEDLPYSWNLFLFDRLSTSVQALARRAPGMPSLSPVGSSWRASISADAGVVTFSSDSAHLVPGQQDDWDPWLWPDPAGSMDVFVRDRGEGETELASHAASSPVLSRSGYYSVLSGDGRYVLFGSSGADVVAGQTQTSWTVNVFLLDRQTGTATLASHIPSSATAGGNSDSYPVALSGDGRWALFQSHASNIAGTEVNTSTDVFLYDRLSGAVTLVSHAAGSPATTANSSSYAGAISDDGRWVAFASGASNLVPGQVDTSSSEDVFLFDRLDGSIRLLSRGGDSPVTAANASSFQPRISADGSRVLFTSQATNLIKGLTDTNNATDLFLWERTSDTLTLVSHAATSPTVTASSPSGPQWGESPSAISADGSAVVFSSDAIDLVAGQIDTNGFRDVFLYESATGEITLVSHNSASPVSTGSSISDNPAISADGGAVAFESAAADLVPGQADANGSRDIFLWSRDSGVNLLVSGRLGSPQTTGWGNSQDPRVSGDGQCVLFDSTADDLVFGDFNGWQDVFLFCDASDPRADLAVTVADSADPVLPGAALAYTVAVSNVGPTPASGVTATFALPAGATYLGASGDGWTCGPSGGTVVCTRPELAVGTAPLFTVQTTAPLAGTSASATASAAAATLDPVPGNGSDTETTRLQLAAIYASPASGLATREEGAGIAAFALVLERQPAANVTVAVSSSDLTEGTVSPPSVTFTPADWATPRIVTVTGVEDDVRDGDTLYTILTGAASSSDPAYAGLNPADVTVVNVDDESIGVFYTVTPCRLLDTREWGYPLSGDWDFGLQVADKCGIPLTARAIAANVTVTEPSGAGHLTIFPSGGTAPLASTINFQAGQTRANNAVLPLPATGYSQGYLTIQTFVPDYGTVHAILDVTGYFE